MKLTSEQHKAVEGAVAHAKHGRGAYTVAGLAGTGKTVTLIETVNRLREQGLTPAVCTPTGKASQVINSKAPQLGSQTLHSRLCIFENDTIMSLRAKIGALEMEHGANETVRKLYQELDEMRSTSRGNKMRFRPREPEELEADVLVFDETSMIGRETYDQFIAHFGVPMIFFGDQGQLPPVNDQFAINLDKANVRLTEIQRQAADSGIILYSRWINQRREWLQTHDLPDVKLIRGGRPMLVEHFLPDHQVICWTNNNRRRIAQLVRRARGFTFERNVYPFLPMLGETLMVDTNDYENNVIKGDTFRVRDIVYPLENNPYEAAVVARFDKPCGPVDRELYIVLDDLCAGYNIAPKASEFQHQKWRTNMRGLKVQFDGVITAHKSQGSEWDKVVYFGDMPSHRPEWYRHAYTGVTRARNELVCISTELR
jgi:exodeoxyribonuclease-5